MEITQLTVSHIDRIVGVKIPSGSSYMRRYCLRRPAGIQDDRSVDKLGSCGFEP